MSLHTMEEAYGGVFRDIMQRKAFFEYLLQFWIILISGPLSYLFTTEETLFSVSLLRCNPYTINNDE